MSASDYAIRAAGIGKQYRLGLSGSRGAYSYKSLGATLSGMARRPFRALRDAVVREPLDETNSFWALKDIDFEVKRGEVVGIIGRNGAGKSTLLKILSRITKPTTGQIDLNGRVGSLLEVGTGFHPELTGRENIFLNGAVLGMTRAEVRRKFDEIVAFSEIEKFIDTPVKQYSSGMYMRLAFAVAANLEPEILVIDEVLAVGDAQFQRKCLGRMDDIANAGRTVLFVSHDLGAVDKICSAAIVLQSGAISFQGDTKPAIKHYTDSFQRPLEFDHARNQSVSIDRIRMEVLEDSGWHQRDWTPAGTPFQITIDYTALHEIEAGISLRVSTPLGVVVFDTHEFIGRGERRQQGRYSTQYTFDALRLAPGIYRLSVYVMVHHGPIHLVCHDLTSFEVKDVLHTSDGGIRAFDIGGVMYARPAIETQRC